MRTVYMVARPLPSTVIGVASLGQIGEGVWAAQ
jgi:hypothetical protein